MKKPLTKLSVLVLTIVPILFYFNPGIGDEKRETTNINNDLRLITHNVWYGFTKVPERKKQWLEWMRNRQPDVVALQELNEYTPEKLADDAEQWNHPHSVLLKTEGFPTGITSSYPINNVQRQMKGFHHGLLRVQIKGIYFYVIHLHPSDWQARFREAGLILEDIEKLPSDARVVLAGDFNALSSMDSMYYARTDLESFFRRRDRDADLNEHNLNRNRLDYTVIQRILDTGLSDLSYRFRPDDYTFTGSFPTSVEKEGNHGDQRRLDYIFVTENLVEKTANAAVVSNDTTRFLSDHLPVIADFRLE